MEDQVSNLGYATFKGSIYAGFWRRFASLLIDSLLTMPYLWLDVYLRSKNEMLFYSTLLFGFVFQLWFSIYLVKVFGGTPGRLIVGIKILKLNGSDITWREAILRESLSIGFSIFAFMLSLYALPLIDWDYYDQMGWLEKSKYVFGLTPKWDSIFNWSSSLWIFSEFVVLLLNKQKRAIHDYIAGTVIIKTKYIDKFREGIQYLQNTV